MSDWDEKEISAEFRRKALRAEEQGVSCSERARMGVMGAEVDHDHALSEFFVYDYLQGRKFLKSRAALLSELRHFRNMRQTPTGAFDQNRFQEVRDRIVDQLIERFEAEEPSP